MKTTNFLPLSQSILWITLLASIILLAGIAVIVYQWLLLQQPHLLFALILLVVALLSCMVIIPRKITVTTEQINIHLLAWKINIPADEIEKIEHYPHGIQSSRIAGAGG